MRYLFVTIDGGGNLYPALAIASRLVDRGHTVRFLGGTTQRATIESVGCAFSPWQTAPDINMTSAETSPVKDWEDTDPMEIFAQMCDRYWFGPSAEHAADLLSELERHPTDVVVVDYFLPGAVAGAESAGIPTVVLWHTTFGEWSVWNQGLERLNATRQGLGLPPVDDVYQQYREADSVLVLTSRVFDFAAETMELPANVVHAGPQLMPGNSDLAEISRRDMPTPLVLVGLSTTYQAQERFLRNVIHALGTLPVRGLVTTGPAITLDTALPGNVDVEAWRSHADVLPEASLVITHAGMGTVMAALTHGVPLLCAPMGRDQHGNAGRVERLGAGRTIPSDASPHEIANAISDLLRDSEAQEAARRIGVQLRADVSEDVAIHTLEDLAAKRTGTEAST